MVGKSIPSTSMVVFGVVGVTRTTGTTLEHQVVGWLTVIGSDSLVLSIKTNESLPLVPHTRSCIIPMG